MADSHNTGAGIAVEIATAVFIIQIDSAPPDDVGGSGIEVAIEDSGSLLVHSLLAPTLCDRHGESWPPGCRRPGASSMHPALRLRLARPDRACSAPVG